MALRTNAGLERSKENSKTAFELHEALQKHTSVTTSRHGYGCGGSGSYGKRAATLYVELVGGGGDGGGGRDRLPYGQSCIGDRHSASLLRVWFGDGDCRLATFSGDGGG
jgi:hypothetical protein